jgi:hypothetical protein
MRKLFGGLAGVPPERLGAEVERRLQFATQATDDATRKARAFPENDGRKVSKIKVDHKRVGVNSLTISIPHKLGRKPSVVRPLASTNETLGRYRVVKSDARQHKIIISESVSGSIDFWVS